MKIDQESTPLKSEPLKFGAQLRIRLRSLKQSLEHLSRHAIGTLYVWLLIGIALSLPTGFWLIQHNIHEISSQFQEDTGFTVYFDPSTDESTIQSVFDSLQTHVIVQELELTTSDQALAEFQRITGYEGELNTLANNPLPASISVIQTPSASKSEINRLLNWFQSQEGVDSVDLDIEWSKNLNTIRHIVFLLMLTVGTLFGLCVVLVTLTTVRLAIESKFEELRVLSLLGAPDSQLRRPFLYCGLLYGVGGGFVAAAIVTVSLYIVEQPIAELVMNYGGDLKVAGLDLWSTTTLIVSGGLLGLLGAYSVIFFEIHKRRAFEAIS